MQMNYGYANIMSGILKTLENKEINYKMNKPGVSIYYEGR